MISELLPFRDATSLIPDGAALAARLRTEGYLFLRGLLPTDVVRDLQRQVGTIVRDAGWLRRDPGPAKRARAERLLAALPETV